MLSKLFNTLKEDTKREMELNELSMMIESSDLRESLLDDEGEDDDMEDINIPENVEETALLEALIEDIPETIVDEASMRGLALLSPLGFIAYTSMSLSTFMKVMRSKNAQKWITEKCEKTFKSAKNKNPNLEYKLPEGMFKQYRANMGSWNISDSIHYDIFYIKDASHKFNLAIFLYNKTIKKFKLILWDKKKEDFEYIAINFGKFQVNKDYDKDVDSDE